MGGGLSPTPYLLSSMVLFLSVVVVISFKPGLAMSVHEQKIEPNKQSYNWSKEEKRAATAWSNLVHGLTFEMFVAYSPLGPDSILN